MKIPENIFATQGQRFAHFFIDRLIATVLTLGIGFILGLIVKFTGDYSWINWLEIHGGIYDTLFGIFVFLIYYFALEAFTGKTIGKMITGTIVLNDDGSKITSGTALKRTLCRIIPFEQFSFIGGSNRGWHDTIPKTIVVKEKAYNYFMDKSNSIDGIGNIID